VSVSNTPTKLTIQKNEIDGVSMVYMNLYGLCYSLVFMDSVMWWIFSRDELGSYYSIS
jgi:hypothetical protein